MQIKNTLTKISGFILGIIFVGGIVSATAIWNIDIQDKSERDIIYSDGFNTIVNTLKNVYNNEGKIGINESAPQETLDVNGDIIVSDILNKDGNYNGPNATLGCSTLGTDNTGKLECHSSYAWVYSGWSGCSKSCGGGTKTRTATCKRDDGKTVNNSFCKTVPNLSGSCNTHSCCTNKNISLGTNGGTCINACNNIGQNCSSSYHRNVGTEGRRWNFGASCNYSVRGWPGDCGGSPGNRTSCSYGTEAVRSGSATCYCRCK